MLTNFEYNDTVISQRDDGYINLSSMCRANGKLIADFARLKSTKDYLAALSEQMRIPANELLIVQNGISTWGHPKLVENLHEWLTQKPNTQSEAVIINCLAIAEKGEKEVQCKTGSVDVLTKKEVIEVKRIKSWKHAVGQVLIYNLEFPRRKPRIHLYGQCSDEYQLMIESYCHQLGVKVSWEH